MNIFNTLQILLGRSIRSKIDKFQVILFHTNKISKCYDSSSEEYKRICFIRHLLTTFDQKAFKERYPNPNTNVIHLKNNLQIVSDENSSKIRTTDSTTLFSELTSSTSSASSSNKIKTIIAKQSQSIENSSHHHPPLSLVLNSTHHHPPFSSVVSTNRISFHEN